MIEPAQNRSRTLAPAARRFPLAREEGGVAAVEFAILSAIFFLAICAALDFSGLFLDRGRLNEAVSAAAVNAFTTADNVDFNALPGYVRALADDQGLAVTTSCNGVAGSCTNLARTCACLRIDGTYAAGVCSQPCTGANISTGSTAGYYLTVRASHTFQPVIVPGGMLGNTLVAQQATVRLQ